MATDPYVLDLDGGSGPSYGAQEYRQADTALHAGPSAGQVFSGIIGGQVSIIGTAITIAPLEYVLNGASAPGSEGAYRGLFLTGDPDLSKTLTAAHATLARIDSIRVRIYNHNADGSGQRRHAIEYTAGTAGSGVPPTAPSGTSYEFARIAVPASGGGSPVVTMVGRAFTGPGGARPGTTSGDMEIYDFATGAWRRVYQSVGAHFQGGYDPGVPSSIANSTWTPVPVTDVISSSRVTLVGGNSLRIEEAGLYQCNGQVRLNSGVATGTGWSRFSVNGVEKRQNPVTLIAAAITLPLSCQLRLNVLDVVRFEVFQGQGSSRLFSNGVFWNFIDIARVS